MGNLLSIFLMHMHILWKEFSSGENSKFFAIMLAVLIKLKVVFSFRKLDHASLPSFLCLYSVFTPFLVLRNDQIPDSFFFLLYRRTSIHGISGNCRLQSLMFEGFNEHLFVCLDRLKMEGIGKLLPNYSGMS